MLRKISEFFGEYKPSNVFGFLLAVILLGFYFITWLTMIKALFGDVGVEKRYLTDGFFYVATSTAGIASALAIAVLGVTPPGEKPSFNRFVSSDDNNSGAALTMLYLVAWIIIGALSVLFGVILSAPADAGEGVLKAYQNLKSYGTTWFGMALSSVFVYLKIKPGA